MRSRAQLLGLLNEEQKHPLCTQNDDAQLWAGTIGVQELLLYDLHSRDVDISVFIILAQTLVVHTIA